MAAATVSSGVTAGPASAGSPASRLRTTCGAFRQSSKPAKRARKALSIRAGGFARTARPASVMAWRLRPGECKSPALER